MASPIAARLWLWIADFSARHARGILIVAALVTILCGYGLSGLCSDTDLDDFLGPEARAMADAIADDFDEGTPLMLIFESLGNRSLLEPELLKRQLEVMETIHERYEITSFSLVEGLDKGLRRIKRLSLREVEDFDPVAQALLGLSGPSTVRGLAKVSHHMVSHPDAVLFYVKLRLVGAAGVGMMEGQGADDTSYGVPFVKAIKAYVRVDAGYSLQQEKEILHAIPRLGREIGAPDFDVRATNNKLIGYELDERSRQNAWMLGVVALVVDGFCIWLLFRARRELGIVAVILSLAAVWSFGLAALGGMHFSFFHLVALPILLGTGIDDTFVFGRRFAEERARGAPLDEVLRRTFLGTGDAIALTTFTTLISFLITGFTGSNPITRSFFQFVALSMAIVFVLSTFLQGALRTELGRHGAWAGAGEEPPPPSVFDSGTRLLTGASFRLMERPGLVVAVAGAVLAVALIGVRDLRGGSGPRDTLSPGMQSHEAQEALDRYFSDNRVGYVLFDGAVENPELLLGMQALRDRLKNEPTVEQVLGRANVDSVLELLEKRGLRLQSDMDVRAALESLAADERNADYVRDRTFAEALTHVARRNGRGYDGLLMRFYTVGGTEMEVQATVDVIQAAIADLGLDRIPGVRARVGGGDTVYGIESRAHTGELLRIFALSLLVNWLLLLLVWRRVGLSLIAMTPVMLAVVALLGFMGAVGITLQVLTITVGAIAVGLGIDYPIHIIERYREERERGGVAHRSAARTALLSMGPHILASALTTIFGFGAACVLALPMAVHFGLLTGAAILLVYLTSLFFLPALLISTRTD